jgi:hypothetical protein
MASERLGHGSRLLLCLWSVAGLQNVAGDIIGMQQIDAGPVDDLNLRHDIAREIPESTTNQLLQASITLAPNVAPFPVTTIEQPFAGITAYPAELRKRQDPVATINSLNSVIATLQGSSRSLEQAVNSAKSVASTLSQTLLSAQSTASTLSQSLVSAQSTAATLRVSLAAAQSSAASLSQRLQQSIEQIQISSSNAVLSAQESARSAMSSVQATASSSISVAMASLANFKVDLISHLNC